MTVASEIIRLQGAKASAKASIENKGVSVPANATVDTYHTYIDQISTGSGGDLWIPDSYVMPNIYINSNGGGVQSQLGDIINNSGDIYYKYFWVRVGSSNAYLSVFYKPSLSDPGWSMSQAYGSDTFAFFNAGYRMKKSGNDIVFSGLFYEYTNGTQSAKDHYYCINATNTTFSSKIDLGIKEDIGYAQVIANWTQACGITESESIPAINKMDIDVTRLDTSNRYSLIATFN